MDPMTRRQFLGITAAGAALACLSQVPSAAAASQAFLPEFNSELELILNDDLCMQLLHAEISLNCDRDPGHFRGFRNANSSIRVLAWASCNYQDPLRWLQDSGACDATSLGFRRVEVRQRQNSFTLDDLYEIPSRSPTPTWKSVLVLDRTSDGFNHVMLTGLSTVDVAAKFGCPDTQLKGFHLYGYHRIPLTAEEHAQSLLRWRR